MNYRLLSFVLRSKQRKNIILSLEKPRTPTEIASHLKLDRSQVSRTLIQFSENDLVICVTPKERVGRIYILTKKGKEILKHLKR